MNSLDRYMARLIAVPLLANLVIAAMLLILDRIRILLEFVADEGGPVSVVWRMLANLLPEYLGLGIPIGLMLGVLFAFRRLATSSELDVMRGLGSGEGPYFRIMNGPREGQRIELSDAQELVFGREDGVDVVLKDDLVSRRHAKVRRDWSGTHVEDLGSRNGIKVNKKRTTRKTLKDRDELEIGGVRLLYMDPSEVRETPLVLAVDRGADEEEHTNSTSEEPASEPSESDAAHASAAEEPEPQAAAEEEPAAEEPEPEPDEPDPEPDLAAADDSDEPEDRDFDPDESPSDEQDEDEDEDALPPGRSSPGARGGKGQKSALGNITLVVKDVRKLVPIAVFGVFCLLALGVLIAIFAGA